MVFRGWPSNKSFFWVYGICVLRSVDSSLVVGRMGTASKKEKKKVTDDISARVWITSPPYLWLGAMTIN